MHKILIEIDVANSCNIWNPRTITTANIFFHFFFLIMYINCVERFVFLLINMYFLSWCLTQLYNWHNRIISSLSNKKKQLRRPWQPLPPPLFILLLIKLDIDIKQFINWDLSLTSIYPEIYYPLPPAPRKKPNKQK